MNATKYEQVQGYLQIVKALADAVKESGPLGIGVGPLYATCMGIMSLDAFERTIGLLTSSGLVKRNGHCLTWVEPVQRRD